MQLGCTKKLIDYLECDVQDVCGTADPFFNFTANIVTVNRRKCITVIHNESRCGFILYGITAKDKKNINALILQGIEAMLKAERYCDFVIKAFISECGNIAFTKTIDRKAVARSNKFTERLFVFADGIDGGDIFQQHILSVLNDDIVKFDNDYERTYVKLANDFEKHFGIPPYLYRAMVFDVELELCEAKCSRQITVPEDISFFQFHLLLQQLFEWEDSHLHRFILKGARNGDLLEYTSTNVDEDSAFEFGHAHIFDEFELKLFDVFPRKKKITYEYDFGDSWMHTVRYKETVEKCTLPAPTCTKIEGAAPPEDCGGAWGFDELKEALEDKDHPRHDELIWWYGSDKLHTKTIHEINSDLKYAIRYSLYNLADYFSEDYE